MNDFKPRKFRITVLTPKNQAKEAMHWQTNKILGLAGKDMILEKNLLSHDKFELIVLCRNQKQVDRIVKKGAAQGAFIKRFYKTIFGLVDRANKLASKFKKGEAWVKRWFIRQADKVFGKDNDMKDTLANMDIKEFLKITDREEMQEFLKKELIKLEELPL